MIETIQQFRDASVPFIELCDSFAQKHNLIGRSIADHMCYKCGSKESFETMRALFETESTFMYQAIISGRCISYIKLKEGIETALGVMSFVELSDQKPDGSQKEGFDHIEVYPSGLSYEDMVAALAVTETVVHVERPHHTTDDVDMGGGFLFRATQEALTEKIKRTEFF